MIPIPIMWLVWGIAFGASTALLGPPRIWAGVDPTARISGHYRATGFMTWSSSTSHPVRDACNTTIFGVSAGQRRVRARIDGEEQNLDWSWSKDVRTPVGERQRVVVEYLDPVGGALLARHEVPVSCADLLPEVQ